MSGSKAGEIIGSKEETEIRDHQPQCDNTINALTIGSDFGVLDFGTEFCQMGQSYIYTF